MKCKRCGTELKKIKTSKAELIAVKQLGVEFGGKFRCPKCYKIYSSRLYSPLFPSSYP